VQAKRCTQLFHSAQRYFIAPQALSIAIGSSGRYNIFKYVIAFLKGGATVVDPTPRIGKEIRRVRTEQGLTLEEAAQRSNVSKAMLGQIERGESNPTISILWKISSGLRVSLSTLLSFAQEDYEVISISDLPAVRTTDGKMQLYDVFSFNPISGFEYFYITLEPGARHASNPHDNASGEYIVVTEGTLTLLLEDKAFELRAPAAIQFHPLSGHAYENRGKERVVFQNIVRY
jgi:transcriptional regulator with XRE-family HTH domain